MKIGKAPLSPRGAIHQIGLVGRGAAIADYGSDGNGPTSDTIPDIPESCILSPQLRPECRNSASVVGARPRKASKTSIGGRLPPSARIVSR